MSIPPIGTPVVFTRAAIEDPDMYYINIITPLVQESRRKWVGEITDTYGHTTYAWAKWGDRIMNKPVIEVLKICQLTL